MQLTSRDFFILDKLTRCHLTTQMVLDVTQAHRRPFTSKTNVHRRMKQLVDAGLVRHQPLATANGRRCYFLSRKAARLVFSPVEYSLVKTSKVLFSGFPITQEVHHLGVNRFVVKLEIDAARAGIEFPLFVRDGHFIYRTVIDGKSSRLQPDGTAVLIAQGKPDLFFLEFDLSTEKLQTIRTNARNTKSFADKIRKYTLFRREYPTITLGEYTFDSFRVITVCKSKQRLKNLVGLAASMNKRGMFQFITQSQYLHPVERDPQTYQDASLLHEIGFHTPEGVKTLYPASERGTGSKFDAVAADPDNTSSKFFGTSEMRTKAA